MTLYQIEVRANAEQYDILAQQVAREILKLPGIHLPSLAAISTSPSPLTISTSQLYYLTGQLTPTQIDQLIQQLLIDPVTQEAEQTQEQELHSTARIDVGIPLAGILEPGILEQAQKQEINNTAHLVDIYFHPGVTDTLAESVLTGASMLGITTLEHVETGRRYIFDKRLSEEEVRFITKCAALQSRHPKLRFARNCGDTFYFAQYGSS